MLTGLRRRNVPVLLLLLALAACRPPDQHFRGEIIDVEGDVLGRYWVVRQTGTK